MSGKLTELIENGGFEAGVLAPWTVVAGTVVATSAARAHSGDFVASIGPNAILRQVIRRGLTDEKVYRLSGALSDNGSGSIDIPENPTTLVRFQFINEDGDILETFTKKFNRLTIPENTEGNYRVFNLLAKSPDKTVGAIVSIETAADGLQNNTIFADDFSLIQENDN
ncbi:hypothetical protein RB620_29660 [Paenibacillus sp. LHD-117]|uniref:hypothetical protein n=1 Tax=Paenibacillus sp. LHD-117 TaxID=3071412 RepID=UPI0027E029D7|nr:hypothetical protein [Paenibacillus sp. LHD-117]MDQ6423584.1 hypothetical protein [Paenibacillus sp. LHD-117]